MPEPQSSLSSTLPRTSSSLVSKAGRHAYSVGSNIAGGHVKPAMLLSCDHASAVAWQGEHAQQDLMSYRQNGGCGDIQQVDVDVIDQVPICCLGISKVV